MRTYMLEYGDSRDRYNDCSFRSHDIIPFVTSYFINDEQYRSEKNIGRQYAHQKVWPRAVYVRRARQVIVSLKWVTLNNMAKSFYHSSRLRWNSIERRRGVVEDSLIDDLVEWSVWQYAIIRRLVLTSIISQSIIIACDLGLANLF